MRYRWGILGAGAIAKEMAQALTHLQGEIYAVASRTRESAERLAAQYPVQTVYDRPEALFADPAVDIVYIATPHNLHAQAMRQAVKAGKHVLCEKAITVNSAELKEIRALAKQHGVIVEEAMTL